MLLLIWGPKHYCVCVILSDQKINIMKILFHHHHTSQLNSNTCSRTDVAWWYIIISPHHESWNSSKSIPCPTKPGNNFNTLGVKTRVVFPWPSFPPSPGPQDHTFRPSELRIRVWAAPQETCLTCPMAVTSLGVFCTTVSPWPSKKEEPRKCLKFTSLKTQLLMENDEQHQNGPCYRCGVESNTDLVCHSRLLPMCRALHRLSLLHCVGYRSWPGTQTGEKERRTMKHMSLGLCMGGGAFQWLLVLCSGFQLNTMQGAAVVNCSCTCGLILQVQYYSHQCWWCWKERCFKCMAYLLN